VRDLRTANQQEAHTSGIAEGKKKTGPRQGALIGWSILNHLSGIVYEAQSSIQLAMREGGA